MRLSVNRTALLIAAFAALFSIFPLTDTDIWWHLACAREWVTTWTPVRTPVVNVHEYFQMVVSFVYGLGGAPLLVAFKAMLWGIVFALFLRSCEPPKNVIAVFLLFIFRYHLELRPVLFSLLFLGIYWNVLPSVFLGNIGRTLFENEKRHCEPRRGVAISSCGTVTLVLAIQWFWCKCQGLYILGPLFALLVLVAFIWDSRRAGENVSLKSFAWRIAFVLALFAMPFLHREGLNLFLYPFGLLDRLLGLSPSAAVFASEIAENRSPITLLMAGENTLECVLMIALCVAGIIWCTRFFFMCHPEPIRQAQGKLRAKLVVEGPLGSEAISRRMVQNAALLVTAILALVAERNFVLFLPVFFSRIHSKSFFGFPPSLHSVEDVHSTEAFVRIPKFSLVCAAFLLGLWGRSLSAYDSSMVAYQRVPVGAANWMLQHRHAGRLFNDDRAGGYFAFMNPTDSIYIDGRFILKTADFFERYLEYANNPALFLADADSLNIDRAVFPLRYYARWDSLLHALEKTPRWRLAYRDDYFVVFDKK